jgi:hypothetical protein
VYGEIFSLTIGRAAWEACSVTWNLGTNSAFSLGPRKTTENLDRVGRSQDLPNANCLLASSPALNPPALTLVRICVVCFFFSLTPSENYLRAYTSLIPYQVLSVNVYRDSSHPLHVPNLMFVLFCLLHSEESIKSDTLRNIS